MATKGGAKLGTRIAMLVSKTLVMTHHQLIGVKHKLAMAVFHSISDTISAEVHQALDPVFRALLDSAHDTGLATAAIKFMANETGQLQALSGTSALSGSILASLGQIINNELAPAVQGYIGSNPHGLPDTGTMATLAAHNIADAGDMTVNMAKAGLSSGWAADIIELNVVYPDFNTALDLVRRGIWAQEEFIFSAQRNGIDAGVAEILFGLLTVPLSPADAALAVLRGNMSQGDGQAAAAMSGVSADNFAVLMDNTGEPLGLEQLLEAFRRGFIDQATLEEGILQSRVRDQWIPTALQLAYEPMSVADAVNAVVQNQLDQPTAETYAQQNGLMPGMFDILLATAGEPLSRTEMEDLYNRGLVTEAQVEQALSESRLKNKYNGLAFELHTKLLNPSTLSDAVLYGAMSESVAVGKALELGYSQDDATTMILAASNAKMFAYRTRIVENIAELYEVNAIDNTTATGYITSLGWSTEEAAVILESAEYNREKRVQEAAITGVRGKYIAHHIDLADVQSALNEVGVPQGEIDYLTGMWTLELDANVEHLTPMYVSKAVAAQAMTQADAVTYLMNLGYSESDSNILIQVAG